MGKFIAALIGDIAKTIIASLIYYLLTNSINGTYYFALGFCIGLMIWDTIKAIASEKHGNDMSKPEQDEQNNE